MQQNKWKNCLLALLILLSSCSFQSKINRKISRAERKIEKLTIKYPQLLQKDTLYDTISIITKEVKMDTSFIDVPGDTTFVYKDKLKIKYVRINDSVYIEGKCESDTLIQFIEIPFERIVVQESSFITSIKNNILKIALSILILMIALLSIRITWIIIKKIIWPLK